jgi:cytochrome c556
MRQLSSFVLIGLVTVVAGGCTPAPPQQPFNAAASVLDVMEGPIAHAAEVYWGSVSTTIDKDGITEKYPQTDEEWEAVWASAITISESGNLLMMSPRARDNEDWMTFSADLVKVGVDARQAAESKNPDKVLELGEQVYNVCTACHAKYIVEEE